MILKKNKRTSENRTMTAKMIASRVIVDTGFVEKKIFVDSIRSFDRTMFLNFRLNLFFIRSNCIDMFTVMFILSVGNGITINTLFTTSWTGLIIFTLDLINFLSLKKINHSYRWTTSIHTIEKNRKWL